MHTIKQVTFFGSSKGRKGQPNFDSAFEVAKSIANSGRTVVNGGGPGVMYAATLGAKAGGGKNVAVYYSPKHATTFEGREVVNMADESYEEANYIMRTKKLLELGDAYIVFNGGTGTISEMAMAWGLARLYFGHHKPVLLYGKFWKPLIEEFTERMMIRKEELSVISIVTSPLEVLETLDRYEAIIKHNRKYKVPKNNEESSFLLF